MANRKYAVLDMETFEVGEGDRVKFARFDRATGERISEVQTAKVEKIDGFDHLYLDNGMSFNKQGGRREPGASVAANMKKFDERLCA